MPNATEGRLDDAMPAAKIREFANAIDVNLANGSLAPEALPVVEAMIAGDKSDEFYRGLVAGMAQIVLLLQTRRANGAQMALAAVSRFMVQKEIY